MDELTLRDITRWRNELAKTRHINTVRNYITRLRSVLNYCSIRGIECLDVRLVPIPERAATVPTFIASDLNLPRKDLDMYLGGFKIPDEVIDAIEQLYAEAKRG